MKKTILQLLLLFNTFLFARVDSENLKLDSLTTFGWNSDTQGYDSVSYIYHKWDTDLKRPIGADIYKIKKGKRINFRKSEVDVTQYADSAVYMVTTYSWQANTQTWQNLWMDEFRVHRFPLKSYNLRYVWDNENSKWAWGNKTLVAYDQQGRELVNEIYNWNVFMEKWVFFDKTEFTYNSQGQVTSKTGYNDRNNYLKWQMNSKDIFVYDANGRKQVDSLYYMPEDTIKLYGVNQYKYDEKGRLLTEEIYKRSVDDTIGLDKVRQYTYPDSNVYVAIVVESVRVGDSLKQKTRYTRSYDSGNNLIWQAEHTWDNEAKIWEPSEKIVYEYNQIGKPSFTNYYWSYPNSNWSTVASFEKYHYSAVTVGIVEQDLNAKPTLYPNPARDTVFLNVTTDVQYTVYNSIGHILLQGKGRQVDMTSLDEGSFLVVLDDHGKISSQKVVRYVK